MTRSPTPVRPEEGFSPTRAPSRLSLSDPSASRLTKLPRSTSQSSSFAISPYSRTPTPPRASPAFSRSAARSRFDFSALEDCGSLRAGQTPGNSPRRSTSLSQLSFNPSRVSYSDDIARPLTPVSPAATHVKFRMSAERSSPCDLEADMLNRPQSRPLSTRLDYSGLPDKRSLAASSALQDPSHSSLRLPREDLSEFSRTMQSQSNREELLSGLGISGTQIQRTSGTSQRRVPDQSRENPEGLQLSSSGTYDRMKLTSPDYVQGQVSSSKPPLSPRPLQPNPLPAARPEISSGLPTSYDHHRARSLREPPVQQAPFWPKILNFDKIPSSTPPPSAFTAHRTPSIAYRSFPLANLDSTTTPGRSVPSPRQRQDTFGSTFSHTADTSGSGTSYFTTFDNRRFIPSSDQVHPRSNHSSMTSLRTSPSRFDPFTSDAEAPAHSQKQLDKVFTLDVRPQKTGSDGLYEPTRVVSEGAGHSSNRREVLLPLPSAVLTDTFSRESANDRTSNQSKARNPASMRNDSDRRDYVEEVTSHESEESGYLEPYNGCETVFLPRPRLRSRSLSDVSVTKAVPERFLYRHAPSPRQLPPQHDTSSQRARSHPDLGDRTQSPLAIPQRVSSLRSSHASNTSTRHTPAQDMDPRLQLHINVPPPPPPKDRVHFADRAGGPSTVTPSTVKLAETGTDTEEVEEELDDADVETVLERGRVLQKQRHKWKEQHQTSFGANTRFCRGLLRRSQSQDASHAFVGAHSIDLSGHDKKGYYRPVLGKSLGRSLHDATTGIIRSGEYWTNSQTGITLLIAELEPGREPGRLRMTQSTPDLHGYKEVAGPSYRSQSHLPICGSFFRRAGPHRDRSTKLVGKMARADRAVQTQTPEPASGLAREATAISGHLGPTKKLVSDEPFVIGKNTIMEQDRQQVRSSALPLGHRISTHSGTRSEQLHSHVRGIPAFVQGEPQGHDQGSSLRTVPQFGVAVSPASGSNVAGREPTKGYQPTAGRDDVKAQLGSSWNTQSGRRISARYSASDYPSSDLFSHDASDKPFFLDPRNPMKTAGHAFAAEENAGDSSSFPVPPTRHTTSVHIGSSVAYNEIEAAAKATMIPTSSRSVGSHLDRLSHAGQGSKLDGAAPAASQWPNVIQMDQTTQEAGLSRSSVEAPRWLGRRQTSETSQSSALPEMRHTLSGRSSTTFRARASHREQLHMARSESSNISAGMSEDGNDRIPGDRLRPEPTATVEQSPVRQQSLLRTDDMERDLHRKSSSWLSMTGDSVVSDNHAPREVWNANNVNEEELFFRPPPRM